jgi:hypothetical protein
VTSEWWRRWSGSPAGAKRQGDRACTGRRDRGSCVGCTLDLLSSKSRRPIAGDRICAHSSTPTSPNVYTQRPRDASSRHLDPAGSVNRARSAHSLSQRATDPACRKARANTSRGTAHRCSFPPQQTQPSIPSHNVPSLARSTPHPSLPFAHRGCPATSPRATAPSPSSMVASGYQP